MMRVISLGWGVQSWSIAAMVALGELPPVDAAIHADTTHERTETYAFAAKWTPWLEERGVPVITVREDNTSPVHRNQVDNTATYILIPAFTSYMNGMPSGMLRRQCTGKWKIHPMRRWLQANRNGDVVEQLIGISVDEVERAKPSGVKYIINRWPLLELGLRRHDLVLWLREHGLEIPVKSSCVFCPFHDREAWRQIQRSNTGDWQRAIEVDEDIRYARENYISYLVPSLRPLAKCDFSNERDHGQLSLFSEECGGNCFL